MILDMTKLYLVRNGEAHRRLSEPFGPSYGLTPEGKAQMRSVGEVLGRKLGVTGFGMFVTAPPLRSSTGAQLMAGIAGTSANIEAVEAFQHHDVEAEMLTERMREWFESLRKPEGGTNVVAVMSRRAIVAALCATDPEQFPFAQVDMSPESPDALVIPTASITTLTMGSNGELGVDAVGVEARNFIQ